MVVLGVAWLMAVPLGAQIRPTAAEARAMAIRAELANVLLQSRQYREAASEFRALLELDPGNMQFRLGLARALAWGGRSREAESELLELRRERPADLAVDSLLVSVRTALQPRVAEAEEWLAERPGFPPYRRALARALTRAGRTGEALAHYDTLFAQGRTSELYLERASVHLERRDHRAAEADIAASVGLEPSVEAFILLGDMRRSEGAFIAARAAYARARALGPGDERVTAAQGRLARDERPPVAFSPDVDHAAGWQGTTTSTGDNLGVRYSTIALRGGLRPVRGYDVGVGGEVRRFDARQTVAGSGATAYGAHVALSRGASRGSYYGRARLRAGFLNHAGGELVPNLSLAFGGWMDAWGAGLDLFVAPAYPALMTLASFLPSPSDGRRLREIGVTAALAGPVGVADVAMSAQLSALSDENTRGTAQGYLRYPMTERASAFYSVSDISYSRGTDAYWSPVRYVSHSVGAEYASRQLRGPSFALRVLPGLAWARERITIDGASAPDKARVVLQAAVSGEASYRAERWEVGAAMTYGRGRAGGYERTDAVLQLRYLP